MNASLKDAVKQVPGVRTIARACVRLYDRVLFRNSPDYWEQRYAEGGTSGRGSYGQFAEFKATVLNEFVREHRVRSVIEFGCGDGAQLSLAAYPSYIGLDVSPTALRQCRTRFDPDPTRSFFLYRSDCFVDHHGLFRAELALSLDVIYHLVEDEVFEAYMSHLFSSASRFVAIYSSNSPMPSADVHVRHRRFSEWVAARAPDWCLMQRVPNRYGYTGDDRTGSPADFYIFQRR